MIPLKKKTVRIIQLSMEEGAEIKNFDREGVVEVFSESRPEEKMFIAKPIFDADVVINLPKLKTHSAAIYTGAVKNVFGCIPGLRKAWYHKSAPEPGDFGEIISDIHKAGRFHLHIMDGITAMQGEGPTAGEVYNANKILISTDPLALDTIGAKMIKINIDSVPILATAKKRGIGEGNLDRIILDGDYKMIPTLEGFKLPKRFKSNKARNNKAVIKVIDFFKARPKVNINKCRKCNMCVESCPVQAINRETKDINYQLCIECMCCHELCMYKAVELKSNNLVAGVITRLINKKQ
jgi:ferredoxin